MAEYIEREAVNALIEALVARVRYHIQKANFMGLKEAESTLLLGEAADAIEELGARLEAHNEWFAKADKKIEEYKAAYIAEHDARIAEASKAPRWIPVTERLPLYGQDVLAVRTYGDGEKCQEVLTAHIAVWDEGTGKKWWNATNITHWMPLPEPPMEEEET